MKTKNKKRNPKESIFRDEVSKSIRRHRTGAGITLSTLAKKSGLSVPFISDIEHGRSVPSLHNYVRLMQALNGRPERTLEHVIKCAEERYD